MFVLILKMINCKLLLFLLHHYFSGYFVMFDLQLRFVLLAPRSLTSGHLSTCILQQIIFAWLLKSYECSRTSSSYITLQPNARFSAELCFSFFKKYSAEIQFETLFFYRMRSYNLEISFFVKCRIPIWLLISVPGAGNTVTKLSPDFCIFPKSPFEMETHPSPERKRREHVFPFGFDADDFGRLSSVCCRSVVAKTEKSTYMYFSLYICRIEMRFVLINWKGFILDTNNWIPAQFMASIFNDFEMYFLKGSEAMTSYALLWKWR